MVRGKETLCALGVLLIACSLLEWAEASRATAPSLEVGRRLTALRARKASLKINSTTHFPKAWEMGFGVYREGDIMEKPATTKQRNGIALTVNPSARWPGAVVPYVITNTFTSAQQSVIQSGMAQIAAATCVRFVPRTTQALYITIGNGASGCWSYVGRSLTNSENQVNLQSPDCVDIGTVVHELMHSLGFYHEFTRPDRDEWVTIDQTALDPQYQSQANFFQDNYGKMAPNEVVLYNQPYDYGSVMHYSKYAAAASRARPVMNNLKPWTGDFGNDNGLSAKDTIDINYMYCNSTTTTTARPATTTTTRAATTTTARAATTTTVRAATTTTARAATTTTSRAATTTTTRAPVTTTTARTFPTLFPTLRPGIFTTLIQVPVTSFFDLLRSLPLFNLFSLG